MIVKNLFKSYKNKSLFKPFIPLKIKYQYFGQQQNYNADKDYYRILQLNKNASNSEIKASYYKLAKLYHPDVNKGQQSKFKQIQQAYQVLSDQNNKKQYDSARVFRQGWSKMGNKAQSGSYSYQQFQGVYYNMSPQERQQFQRQTQARFRRYVLYFGGFLLFWIFFSRTPHKAYSEYNGTLIPIDPVSPYQYPDNFNPQQNVYANPHPQYGQPNNPYAGQPYGNMPPQPTQQYGSQYPQGQYMNQSVYQQAVSPGSYPQQQYYPQSVPGTLHKPTYVIDKPQPHQPYPNSGYAQKPMQTNYQPGYKPQAPKGLD